MPSTATSVRRVSNIEDVREAVTSARNGGARIGFVPTMGALHKGHLSLVDRARAESDVIVMSIFVNPTQFGPNEDFARYPRPIEEDVRLTSEAGVDILFTPSVEEMYAEGRMITVEPGRAGRRWEGAIRDGHFAGVLTVVAKLFNIVQPDVAVFGQKDLQQAVLIEAMVRDLDFPIRVIIAPTVRESDGLAMSSRNAYLNAEDRKNATVLIRSLRAAAQAYDSGERDASRIEGAGLKVFHAVQVGALDYLGVVELKSLERVQTVSSEPAVMIAARIGSTRLIDNLLLGKNDQD
jgi:pantoate--beta-alanine ligase